MAFASVGTGVFASSKSAANSIATGSTTINSGDLVVVFLVMDNLGSNTTAGATVTDNLGSGNYNPVHNVGSSPNYEASSAAANAGTSLAAYYNTAASSSASAVVTASLDASPTVRVICIQRWTYDTSKTLTTAEASSWNKGSSGTNIDLTMSGLAAGDLVIGAAGIESTSNEGFGDDSDTTDGSWVQLGTGGAAAVGGTAGGGAAGNQRLLYASKITTGSSNQSWGPFSPTTDFVMGMFRIRETSVERLPPRFGAQVLGQSRNRAATI